ncbi:MAG TPA: nitrilase-related carbon-nitrogen hydrolase [Methylomirabilota bacterium]|nr:nitrilase-related carbon-nitrogen hydrolase [Methylomirabilota bacterium]
MTGIAILQLQAAHSEVQDTLPRILQALEDAGKAGAALLVAPELATTGYGAGNVFAERAETVDGPSMRTLNAAVQRTGVALVIGFAERADEVLYNSAAVLRPGEPPLVYRKAQLYGAYEKACFAVPKVETVTTMVGGLRIGVLVCFDVEFPEHVRRLAEAGCDVVAAPTALPDSPPSRYIAMNVVPVRAFENQVFVAYADWAGSDARFGYAGLSCLAAPDGSTLIRGPANGDFFGVADVDPPAFEEWRRANPYLAELRRP